MKRYVILCAIILGMVAPATMAQEAVKKVAVYMTGNDVSESYKKVIGAKLVSAITATDEYAAVERTADFLAALSAEQDYQTSGEVRDSQIARLGQKFGVRYVAVADMSELFDEIFISARLINVESGLVENAFDTSGPVENMEQLTTLATNVAKGLFKGTFTIKKCSTYPKHLSLRAVANEKVYYITVDEWKELRDDEKASIQKGGICLLNTPAGSIELEFGCVSSDLHKGFEYAYSYSEEILCYISKNYESIVEVMNYFGGPLLPYDRPYLYQGCGSLNHVSGKQTGDGTFYYGWWFTGYGIYINTGQKKYYDCRVADYTCYTLKINRIH